FQAPIKSLGNREIPAHYLDLWRPAGRIRVAGHGAEPRSRCTQLVDNLATDVPGAADDEDTVHQALSALAARAPVAPRLPTPPSPACRARESTCRASTTRTNRGS